MGLYNFQDQFVQPILEGRKTHTIRSRRKNPDKPGNVLHLYTGLRRKGARLLMRPLCTRVEEILMAVDDAAQAQVYIEGEKLSADERELLAVRDGFANWREMVQFWNGRFPFEGHIIHWTPKEKR
jgi:hypothetical protein